MKHYTGGFESDFMKPIILLKYSDKNKFPVYGTHESCYIILYIYQ